MELNTEDERENDEAAKAMRDIANGGVNVSGGSALRWFDFVRTAAPQDGLLKWAASFDPGGSI